MSLDHGPCDKYELWEVVGLPAYILLCAGLTVFILGTLPSLRRRQNRVSGQVKVFAALASLSLGVTWYYMLRFFSLSYHDWASAQEHLPANCLTLGPWLKDPQLFTEAWWTAVATPARFWWTQQIFFFATAWSVFLGREGQRRSIPHTWAYMLLGQIVAISFATNLFFLATLLGPLRQPRQLATLTPATRIRALLLHVVPVAISLASVALIPYVYLSPHFLTVLLIPHLLLFAPLLQGVDVPKSDADGVWSISGSGQYYARIYLAIVACAFCLQAKVTLEASGGVQGVWAIFAALYEHPAVSSVGWDVIMCWLSWFVWALTERASKEDKSR